MTLNRVKLGWVVTFMKYLASVDVPKFLLKTLVWNNLSIKLTGSWRASGKWADGELNRFSSIGIY